MVPTDRVTLLLPGLLGRSSQRRRPLGRSDTAELPELAASQVDLSNTRVPSLDFLPEIASTDHKHQAALHLGGVGIFQGRTGLVGQRIEKGGLLASAKAGRVRRHARRPSPGGRRIGLSICTVPASKPH